MSVYPCASCGDHPAQRGHDLCVRCDVEALGEPSFLCGNCALDWPEPFCSACGRSLVPATDDLEAVPSPGRATHNEEAA